MAKKSLSSYIKESFGKGGYEIKFYNRVVNHYKIDTDRVYDVVRKFEEVTPKFEHGTLIVYFEENLYKDWNKFLDLIHDIFQKLLDMGISKEALLKISESCDHEEIYQEVEDLGN